MNGSPFSSKKVVTGMLDVAKGIIELIPKLQAARREKRLRISQLMGEISECLVSVSAEIRVGNVPHGKCGQLVGFADELPRAIQSITGKRRARELGMQLHAAHRVEELAVRLDRIQNKEPYLAKLEEAGGKFRAVARVLGA